MLAFTPFKLQHGLLADLRGDQFPTLFSAWVHDALTLRSGGTHFGFVQAGPAELSCGAGTFRIRSGMYFAVPGEMQIGGGNGVVITRLGHHGFFHLGGPIEDTGRLRYIDGCTDSLLIPPIIKGDPCLNLLDLPPKTRQSAHTHSSLRLGLVIRGRGSCHTAEQRIPLAPGLPFLIRAEGIHCFHTEDEPLLVLAYHPDSDFGPTHEDHPMINRTDLIAVKEPRHV